MRRLLICAAVVLVAAAVSLTGADARSMASADTQIAQQATPAVVSISLWKVRDASKPGGSPRRVKVYGSGFIIDPSGIMVTNKHVIDGAINAQVVMSDGTPYPAKVLAVAANGRYRRPEDQRRPSATIPEMGRQRCAQGRGCGA